MGLPFTITAECALEHARLAVEEFGHEYVGTEHLLNRPDLGTRRCCGKSAPKSWCQGSGCH